MPRGVLLGELSVLGAPPYQRQPGEHCFVVARDPATGDAIPHVMRWGIDVAGTRRRRLQLRADQLAGRRLGGMARCIVPVSGYAQPGLRRTRLLVTLAAPMSLAVAAVWKHEAGGSSFAIVTTEADDELQATLARTPVLLPPAAWPRWLADGPPTKAALAAIARPAPSAWLRIEQRRDRVQPPRPLAVTRQVEDWAPGSMAGREPVLRFGPGGRDSVAATGAG